jgi:hypothetical protein
LTIYFLSCSEFKYSAFSSFSRGSNVVVLHLIHLEHQIFRILSAIWLLGMRSG